MSDIQDQMSKHVKKYGTILIKEELDIQDFNLSMLITGFSLQDIDMHESKLLILKHLKSKLDKDIISIENGDGNECRSDYLMDKEFELTS